MLVAPATTLWPAQKGEGVTSGGLLNHLSWLLTELHTGCSSFTGQISGARHEVSIICRHASKFG